MISAQDVVQKEKTSCPAWLLKLLKSNMTLPILSKYGFIESHPLARDYFTKRDDG